MPPFYSRDGICCLCGRESRNAVRRVWTDWRSNRIVIKPGKSRAARQLLPGPRTPASIVHADQARSPCTGRVAGRTPGSQPRHWLGQCLRVMSPTTSSDGASNLGEDMRDLSAPGLFIHYGFARDEAAHQERVSLRGDGRAAPAALRRGVRRARAQPAQAVSDPPDCLAAPGERWGRAFRPGFAVAGGSVGGLNGRQGGPHER